MPLPLPNLDTRQWADLVDEGRAMIPRYAPDWTDHNVHDAGVMTIELMAWLFEQEIYRANRVPERHRMAFLRLLDLSPEPPRPATVALAFALMGVTGAVDLPEGLTLATTTRAGQEIRYRTLAPLRVLPTALVEVHSYNGADWRNNSRARLQGLPFHAWGSNPRAEAALYFGFDRPLPMNESASIWIGLAGHGHDGATRDRIEAEAAEQARRCAAWSSGWPCGPVDKGHIEDGRTPLHHSARTVWELFDGATWRPLHHDKVRDETRALTLDGPVVFTPTVAMAPLLTSLGSLPAGLFYLRCRLARGLPDEAPRIASIAVNSVAAEQATTAIGTIPIEPSLLPPPAGDVPKAGSHGHLALQVDGRGKVTGAAIVPAGSGAKVRVLAYTAATTKEGQLTATIIPAGLGTGLPEQVVQLPGGAIATGVPHICSLGENERTWEARDELATAGRADAVFTFDQAASRVHFGDGEHGRVVDRRALILATYDLTDGASGAVGASQSWRFDPEDDPINLAILDPDQNVASTRFSTIRKNIAVLTNPGPSNGGSDAETLNHAIGRAVEELWAHERLVDLVGPGITLDQIPPELVLAVVAPQRATTTLDYERLALGAPGTAVARARAWAGIDPVFPGLSAPGTVTVVILPWLPVTKPAPSAGLLGAVAQFLDRRRTIGTRLRVIGPTYREVRVRASVALRSGAAIATVSSAAAARLTAYFDPLTGGPDGRGWPFGRDIYRSEALQIVGTTDGVDRVSALELLTEGEPPTCGNVCMAPTWLPASGDHVIVEAQDFVPSSDCVPAHMSGGTNPWH